MMCMHLFLPRTPVSVGEEFLEVGLFWIGFPVTSMVIIVTFFGQPWIIISLLKVRVVRGINLAYRDARGSDPYVVLRLGKKKLKTSVKKRSVNPIWHEELTLTVTNPNEPIKLEVFDKDTFSRDDPMGDAEIDVAPLLDAVRMDPDDMRNGAVISSVRPSTKNCLAEESHVCWRSGRFAQDMILRLKNVESGEIQLQLQWVNIPPAGK